MINPKLYSQYDQEKKKEQDKKFVHEYRNSDPTKTVKRELEAISTISNYVSSQTPKTEKLPHPLPNNIGTPYSSWVKENETKQKLNRAKICLDMRMSCIKYEQNQNKQKPKKK